VRNLSKGSCGGEWVKQIENCSLKNCSFTITVNWVKIPSRVRALVGVRKSTPADELGQLEVAPLCS